MRVRRRDGREEEFVREKVVVAIVKAGGRVDIARAVAQEVESTLSRSPIVTTEQIRTEVLNRLKARDKKAYEGWLSYDAQKKRK